MAKHNQIRMLATERDGSVSVLGGALLVVLVGVAAMSAEVGSWYVAKADLQRAADMGSVNGAFAYASSANSTQAINQAVAAAQMNGASTASAQMVTGIKSASDQAVQVTVSVTQPLFLAQVLMSGSSVTINAAAIAEITPPTTGGPACVLALSQSGTGVTYDLTIGGNAQINLNGCTLRSDSSIDVFGSAGVTTLGAYAAGSISGTGQITTTPASGQYFPGAGVIPDPYAGNASLQSAMGQLGSGGGAVSVSPSQTVTLSPGTY
jgi:Flp pilus assembly protein TadG